MPRWDLVYKWADPEARTIVDAVTSALENCDRKLTEVEAGRAVQDDGLPTLDAKRAVVNTLRDCHEVPGAGNDAVVVEDFDWYQERLSKVGWTLTLRPASPLNASESPPVEPLDDEERRKWAYDASEPHRHRWQFYPTCRELHCMICGVSRG